jgi:uncharacterized protein YyaL (SSP411 family)
MAWGLSELYQATFDARYLEAARDCIATMERHFLDREHGGFFLTADDGEQLLARPKEAYDGAHPSGNSAAAMALLQLARLTGDEHYAVLAEDLFKAFGQVLDRSPSGFCQMLSAGEFARAGSLEIVLAGNPGSPDFEALRREVDRRFLPHAVVVHRPQDEGAPILDAVPMLRPMIAKDGRATAYVCRNFACEAPTSDPTVLAAKLDAARPKP